MQFQVELEYCRIKELEEQPEKSEGQKELLFNHRYIEECLSKVKNHGFAFFYCGDYDKCSSFFCQEAIGLKKAISAKMGGSFDLKEIEKAMEVKKQSGLKDLCSSYKMSLFIRAICRNNQKNYEEAAKLMEECVRFQRAIFPSDKERLCLILKEYGKVELNRGLKKESLKLLGEALQLSKELAEGFAKDELELEIMKDIALFKKGKPNKELLERLNAKLLAVAETKGCRNQLYLAGLKTKFVLQNDCLHWDGIVEDQKKLTKLFEKKCFVWENRAVVLEMLYIVAIAFFQQKQYAKMLGPLRLSLELFEHSQRVGNEELLMFVEMVYHCCKYLDKSPKKFEVFEPFFRALLSYKPDKMGVGEYGLLERKLKYLEDVALQYGRNGMAKEFQSFRKRLFDL